MRKDRNRLACSAQPKLCIALDRFQLWFAPDVHRLSGDVAGLVGGQEDGHVAAVFRRAESSAKDLRQHDLFVVVDVDADLLDGFPGHLGLDEFRGDTVDVDVVAVEFDGQRGGQTDHAGIGCGIVGVPRCSQQGRGGEASVLDW